jgi:S-adenosylmethionine hydrolase
MMDTDGRPPVPTAITLITDFGLADGHVGAMKGVMHGIAPSTPLIDISHDVPPQDIRHGAFVLMTAYPFWPSGTVHLIVVDPGVGTQRRPVAVETAGSLFVAPDNGVLSYVLQREPVTRAVQLTNPAYWHHPVSHVFHGRDIFSPAAAHLARGVSIALLGEPVTPESLETFPVLKPVIHADGHLVAHIQHVDRFGNCTTDLPEAELSRSGAWHIDVQGRVLDAIHRTFGDVPEGELLAFVDSTGFLAIGLRNGSAAQAVPLKVGDTLDLWPGTD